MIQQEFVYDYVRRNPGKRTSQILRGLWEMGVSIGAGSVDRHLRYLQEQHKIIGKKLENDSEKTWDMIEPLFHYDQNGQGLLIAR